MAEALPEGYIHETYRRLKRIQAAKQIEGQPTGQVVVYTDLNAKQVTGSFVFPIEEIDTPEINAFAIKAVEYAQ